MLCLCGAKVAVLARHGRYCGRCWTTVAPDRDGTRQLAPRPAVPCAADGCDERALPTSDRCAACDPRVAWLERWRADLPPADLVTVLQAAA